MTTEKQDHTNGAVKKRTKLIPPDGGWGWMVVLGTASINIFNQSMLSIFSLLYGDSIEAMGHSTQGAAFVLSTMLFVTNFGGPISGGYLKLTSPRTVAMTGAALCTMGTFLSGFSTELWHLVLSYGVLLGTGLGLTQTSTFVAINSYFKGKRGRAVGVAMAGTSLGQMLMPFVIRYLLEKYDFLGCCLILSALSLNGLAGSLLIQPVSWHMQRVDDDSDEKKYLLSVPDQRTEETKSCESFNEATGTRHARDRRATEPSVLGRKGSSEKKSSYKELNYADISSTAESLPMMNKAVENEKIQLEAEPPAANKSVLGRITELFDVRLLASPRFLNIIVGTALAVTSIQNFSLVYPFFLKHAAAMDRMQVATCMSTVAGADIVGRLTLPALADRYQVKARVTLVLTSAWLIVVSQVLVHQTSTCPLIITAALYGLGRSMIIVARNIAISENCRLDQVPSAVGWRMMAMGIMGPPIAMFLGWLRDYTGSYILCITAQNVLLVILLVTWIPDLMYLRWKEKKCGRSEELG